MLARILRILRITGIIGIAVSLTACIISLLGVLIWAHYFQGLLPTDWLKANEIGTPSMMLFVYSFLGCFISFQIYELGGG